MSVASSISSWCDNDQHHFFDHYADFKAWLEKSDDAQSLRDDLGLDNLSQPAKALFAGDKAQYNQAFEKYKTNCRQEKVFKPVKSNVGLDNILSRGV